MTVTAGSDVFVGICSYSKSPFENRWHGSLDVKEAERQQVSYLSCANVPAQDGELQPVHLF